MDFRKYMHVERFGTDDVEDIQYGRAYVFPKLDGSNGVVYNDNGIIKAGSRNRELTLDNDNQGFYKYVLENKRFQFLLGAFPHMVLYGEWLVPHSFKGYRQDAWRKFYVFDVYDSQNDYYIPYDGYQFMLQKYGIDFIPALAVIENGSDDQFRSIVDKNDYLVADGCGVGEGIVIKNYGYVNKYGRACYAKIVRNEFKDLHRKEMGPSELQGVLVMEQRIVDEFCSEEFIVKEYHKVLSAKGGWKSEYIPELLGRVYSEFIKEESWNFIKKLKMPTVDYKVLHKLVNYKVKTTLTEVF